jgi:hypothetical protein
MIFLQIIMADNLTNDQQKWVKKDKVMASFEKSVGPTKRILNFQVLLIGIIMSITR